MQNIKASSEIIKRRTVGWDIATVCGNWSSNPPVDEAEALEGETAGVVPAEELALLQAAGGAHHPHHLPPARYPSVRLLDIPRPPRTPRHASTMQY